MEYLQTHPSNLKKYVPHLMNEYPYDFLDPWFDSYEVDLFYLYLNSLEPFQLRHVWNHTCTRWNDHTHLWNHDKGFKKSKYAKYTITNVHHRITPEELNHRYQELIRQDSFMAIIVMRSLLSRGY